MLKLILESLRNNRQQATATAEQDELRKLLSDMPDADRAALLAALQPVDAGQPGAQAPAQPEQPPVNPAPAQPQTPPVDAAQLAQAVQNSPPAAQNARFIGQPATPPAQGNVAQQGAQQAPVNQAPAQPAPGAGLPPATTQAQPTRLEDMTASQINALWDKGDVHRMFGQQPPHNPFGGARQGG